MRVRLIKHSCAVQNMVQLAHDMPPTKCPFYMRMWDAYCFNFLGLRLIIGEYK